jgi:hypothetical protein
MAKYNIRQPFAIHLEIVTDTETPNGAKMRQRTQQSFFPGQPIELNDDQALEHLHKLEPACPESKKFLAAYHAKQDAAAASRLVVDEGPTVAEQIIAALVAAGVIVPKAKT